MQQQKTIQNYVNCVIIHRFKHYVIMKFKKVVWVSIFLLIIQQSKF